MTIASVLRDKGAAVETVNADTSVYDAVRRLGEKRIGALPVVEDARITGIISERDVIYRLRDHGPEMLDWPVSRIMSAPAITAAPDTDVLAALALMTQRRIRHLPVVEGGEIAKPRPKRCGPTSRLPEPVRRKPQENRCLWVLNY